MVEFQEEHLAKVLSEMKVMVRLHWDEVRFNYHEMQLDPDWDKYELLRQAGSFKFYTIRDWGELVGYASFIIDTHLHFKGHKFAYCDTIYVLPQFRNKLTVPKFIKYCEKSLAAIDVEVIQIGTTKTNKHERFMKGMGYDMNQFVSTKRIK